MKIDSKEVERIAALVHLELESGEKEQLAGELTTILAHIDQLREIDVTAIPDVEPELSTPLRDDEVVSSIDTELVSANAPSFAGGFFVVPKVIGGE
ncbi:MAG TPA: Asp-tRNA(Asn)/Glu-tRNA(Gln) amidotransferase subunit GatC [Thermoanaerobaculia bacterium]|nr:Asp-tRNA(Asn)/Glu-tRNA(Gln) amidotransferase subunit GatC [Thermoanaerobaculia bacterium]